MDFKSLNLNNREKLYKHFLQVMYLYKNIVFPHKEFLMIYLLPFNQHFGNK